LADLIAAIAAHQEAAAPLLPTILREPDGCRLGRSPVVYTG
jgi:hypothetical protein